MIVRSLIPTAALALALGGPAAALPVVPSADTALPLILAQADDAEARVRAAEARVTEAEEALREAEEALAEATSSGGDAAAAQEEADAAREALEAAVVELRVAEEEYRAAQQAEAEAEAARQAEAEAEAARQAEAEAEAARQAEAEAEAARQAEAEAEAARQAEAEAEAAQQEPEPEPEPEQLAEPEPAERPSLLERMLGREQAQPEEPASEAPAAEAAPFAAPAETQEAQPDPQETPAETQEAQPDPQEGQERREGRPSLRERMQEREQAQPQQPDAPAAEAAAPADEPQAATEAEPALDETPEERQQRRARRDRRSLEERAEERERRGRPEAAEQAERDRRQAPADEAPGLASELPEGAEVLRREGDRVIFRRGGQEIVRKDESERMRRFSRQTRTEQLRNGWTRTVSVRRSGVEVVTVWDEYGDIVERVRRYPDGREVVMIDTRELRRDRGPTVHLDVQLPPLVVTIPREQYIVETRRASREELHAALIAPPVEELPRLFTLQEVRENERVRDMVPRIDIDTITFEFDSAAIPPDQLDALDLVGQTIEEVLDEFPEEIYLLEGHTDAVGSELYNLALSDRRAESVAFALSEYFDIPPENLVTQGYGKQFLKIPTQEPERENRRVTIRRITPLVTSQR